MDSASALQALQSFQQPAAADVLTQAETKYGIPDLTKRVNDYKTLTHNLTGAIAAVDPSVTGRTAGTLTTEGQRGALVNRERAPIVGQLGTATTALEGATGDENTARTRAGQEANATVEGNKQKYQQLLDTYNIANTREEAARKAAAEEADRQEQMRQFNESQVTSRGSASYGGGSAKTPSAAETKAAQSAAIANNVAKMAGKDGYVSKATFASALRDFQVAGLGDIRKFWQIYGQYTNPATRSQYANYGQR